MNKIINLSELKKINEFPKLCRDLPIEQIQKLEKFLNTKFTEFDVFKDIEEKSIGSNYYILDGVQHHLSDRWGVIIKKIDDDNILPCVGSTFKRTNYLTNIENFQVMLTAKLSDSMNKSASTLYIYLCKKWNCAIFSDSRITNGGKNIWYELLTRPNLDTENINIFVYDTKLRKEITNYGNIDDLFGVSDRFEDIIIGIKPNLLK